MIELESIIEKLERLSKMPLLTKNDLSAWCTRASELLGDLRTVNRSIYDSLPHFIEHYLADADIRLKDVQYRYQQQEQIEACIEELKSKANQVNSANRQEGGGKL